jgi:hypothetical protein
MENLRSYVSSVDWAATGSQLWVFVNQPIICALLPAIIAGVLAQRVNLVVQQNVAATDALKAESRARGKLADQGEGDVSPEAAGGPAGPQGGGSLSQAPPSVSGASSWTNDDETRFQQGAEAINQIKAYVEHVAANARDGRRRRKYTNIPRHDYRVLLLSLGEDAEIPMDDVNRINHALSLWNRFRTKRKSVPDFVIAELKETAKRYTRAQN